ncbi:MULTISPECIES: coiled-coil domain-containing protein [Acinetobacter]|jgi:hypothetical protein|uniref:hypothetical protein n=1 Tax=Acinetobacter TaxID=469 RepID=UPI0021CDBC99|nr:hypothetical protein [Acinetobacter radioresistens]MCU4568511.1 hypothetical protein [Acinetobacter radioresistens]
MGVKELLKRGLDEKDKNELIRLLAQIKNINESLIAKYELRADLIQLVDKRQGAARVVKEEVDTLRKEIDELKAQKQSLTTEIDTVLKFKEDVEELTLLLESQTSTGQPLTDAIKELLTVENYEEWLHRSKTLDEVFEDVYLPMDDRGVSKTDLIQTTYDKSEELNKYLFEKDEKVEVDGVATTRDFLLRRSYKLIDEYHRKLFISSLDDEGNEIPSITSQIDKKKTDLETFHTKIFGDKNAQKISLADALDERLKQLKLVEDEARNVMKMSSTAGLAGGFFEKAKEARYNKWGSLAVFAASLILLAIFNFKHINWENLDSITLQSIAIRVMLNIPLLWLATVANINLNKYSRLEQEYGHKEALAKSYEKYRDEISKLPSLDTEVDDPAMATLHAELIKLNLEAFKKNPTDDMDKAKANFFADRLFNARDTSKESTE